MPLETAVENGEPITEPEIKEIGGRIRVFRQKLGWTLDALASRAGLSKSYISRLEDGDRQPSIASLLSISRAFGTPLGNLLSEGSQAGNFHVVRGAACPTVAGNGLVYQAHSGGFPGSVMQPLRITISVDRTGDERYRHEGEEWIYVLSGELSVTIGDETHSLSPGDSLHFDATVGHRLTAVGDRDVEALLVASVAPKGLLRSYI